jgi:hypothetical protein
MMKTIDKCEDGEVKSFFQLYFATVDVLTEAQDKFRRLSVESTTTSGRSQFRARALEAERDLELLKNQRRAFMDSKLAINPPSADVVARSKTLAAALAKVVAKDAKANDIIDLARQGLDAFNQVTVAA